MAEGAAEAADAGERTDSDRDREDDEEELGAGCAHLAPGDAQGGARERELDPALARRTLGREPHAQHRLVPSGGQRAVGAPLDQVVVARHRDGFAVEPQLVPVVSALDPGAQQRPRPGAEQRVGEAALGIERRELPHHRHAAREVAPQADVERLGLERLFLGQLQARLHFRVRQVRGLGQQRG